LAGREFFWLAVGLIKKISGKFLNANAVVVSTSLKFGNPFSTETNVKSWN